MALPSASRTPGLRRRALTLLWILGGLALLVVLARAFLFDVYRVDSSSMEPWLHGDTSEGERVLVRYVARPELRRFDPVVVLLPGEREPVVKRVAGLPGESVALVGGDLYIDGARLAADVARPAVLTIFDSRTGDLASSFQLSGSAWRHEGALWHLDARGLGPPVEASAAWTARLLDSYLDARGRPQGGHNEIGDAQLELELSLGAGAGFCFITLTEGADRFTLELQPRGDSLAVRLLRSAGALEPEQLATAELPLARGDWLRVALSNRDNRLSAALGDAPAFLTCDYERNTPLEGLPDRSYRHLRPRVSFGAADLDLTLRRVHLARDLHYSDRGSLGVDAPLRLGPDELFLLGDNSSESLDSREFGPVPLDAVVGLPVAVVWPPAAWRPLGGPARAP